MKTIIGDLLDIEAGLILHQVNCRGATGGLAGALRRKWPEAFDEYLFVCSQSVSPAGNTLVSRASFAPDLFIAHVFGQIAPGANTDLAHVESALADPQLQYYAGRMPHFAPYLMGCGLGGGRWDQYLPLLEKYLPQLTLVKLEKQDQK